MLPLGIGAFIFFADSPKNRDIFSRLESGSIAETSLSIDQSESDKLGPNAGKSNFPGEDENEDSSIVRIDNFNRTFKSAGMNWQLTAARGVVGQGGRIKLSEIDAIFFRDKKGKSTQMKVKALGGILHLVDNQIEKIKLTGDVKLSLMKEKGEPLELQSPRVYFENEVLFGFNPTLLRQGVMTFVGQNGFSFFVKDELLNLRDVDSGFE